LALVLVEFPGYSLGYLLNCTYSLGALRSALQMVAQQIAVADDNSQLVYQITYARKRKLVLYINRLRHTATPFFFLAQPLG
jgi:hypothetical protein